MRLIIGLPLTDSYDDLIAASRNLESEDYRRLVREEFFRHFWANPTFHDVESRQVLEELIASGTLQLKILPQVGRGRNPEHGKLQVYYDDCSPPCWVQCAGSKNDSAQGDSGGADFMAVNRSWRSDPELRAGFENYFETRWNHENAVALGEEGTAEILQRLRSDAEEIERKSTDTIARAKDLAATQTESNAVLIAPSGWKRPLEQHGMRYGVQQGDLAVIPVDDGKVLMVLSQFLNEKPIAVAASSPSTLELWNKLWDGPRVRCWIDTSSYGEPVGGTAAGELFSFLADCLDLPATKPSEEKLYAYHHPSGPQEHQVAALEAWELNDFRGLFEHATGTYKTATGLTGIARLFEVSNARLAVITAPQIAIAENWFRQASRDFDREQVRVLRCWSEESEWRDVLEHYADAGDRVIAVFVNDSLWQSVSWPILAAFGEQWALVADEAHNWTGDRRAHEFMTRGPEPALRLALTAQLADPNRPAQAAATREWFAGTQDRGVHRFGLSEALNAGFLRPYDYEVAIVWPSADSEEETIGHPTATVAFSERKAELAVEKTLELAETHRRVLLYTGPSVREANRMASIVSSRVPRGAVYRVDTFTSAESPRERRRILADFSTGLTRVLVAIRCLDEGVDVPVADAAVMCLANEDERQWIQRRGRILRTSGPQDHSTAKIVDFVPAQQAGIRSWELQEDAAEHYRRALKFAELASISSRSKVAAALTEAGW